MTSQTAKVLQVRCSRLLWQTLGWEGSGEHSQGCSPETALVPTPWAYEGQRGHAEDLRDEDLRLLHGEHPSYERRRIKLKLVCGE